MHAESWESRVWRSTQEADKNALFTRYADEAYEIGKPAPPRVTSVWTGSLRLLKKSGAEAIHPGYGFLAENPSLGEEC